VINARGRIVAANKPARALFPEASAGSDASRVLPVFNRVNGKRPRSLTLLEMPLAALPG
jgi:hypothetical protein